MRKLFLVVAVLFTAAVVLQLYFAAVGVFSDPEDELFNWHGTNGRIVLPILALLLIVTAALARAGKRTIWLSVLPVVLILFQTVLFILTGVIFGLDESSHAAPPLAATLFLSLHAVNGAAILLLGVLMIVRARRLVREGAPVKPVDPTAGAEADATPAAVPGA
jgi:tellurite resistance protein TehA-like permease